MNFFYRIIDLLTINCEIFSDYLLNHVSNILNLEKVVSSSIFFYF